MRWVCFEQGEKERRVWMIMLVWIVSVAFWSHCGCGWLRVMPLSPLESGEPRFTNPFHTKQVQLTLPPPSPKFIHNLKRHVTSTDRYHTPHPHMALVAGITGSTVHKCPCMLVTRNRQCPYNPISLYPYDPGNLTNRYPSICFSDCQHKFPRETRHNSPGTCIQQRPKS